MVTRHPAGNISDGATIRAGNIAHEAMRHDSGEELTTRYASASQRASGVLPRTIAKSFDHAMCLSGW
jgi:hypothetical protein